MVIPWLTVGGAEQVHLQIVSGLRARGWQVDLLLTLGHHNEWLSRGKASADTVIDATTAVKPEDFDEFFSLVIQRRASTHVLLSNSERGYAALPAVAARRRDIVLVDLLHGQGGSAENGGSPRYSAPVAHLLHHRITVTHYLKDLLVEQGESPSRISTIHNAVPVVARPDSRADAHRGPTIGFLGRLSPEKRPSVMFDIAELLPDTQVLVAGDGPLRNELAERSSANLRMVGHVEDPYAFLRQLDILVVPSEMEGLPLVILEAMTVGVPVVGACVGGIPEAVDSQTGVLLPEDAAAPEYASAVAELLKDPARRRRLGDAASTRARLEFSPERFVAAYHDLLTRLSLNLRGSP